MKNKLLRLTLQVVGFFLVLLVAIALMSWATTSAQNARTTVRCGGGSEHTLNFVPQSRSGQRVATCHEGQAETWYDNATTDRWRYFTDAKGLFAIRVGWADQSYDDLYFGPIRPGAALEKLEFYPGGGAVPPQIAYKPVGGKITILNARTLADVNRELDAGKAVGK